MHVVVRYSLHPLFDHGAFFFFSSGFILKALSRAGRKLRSAPNAVSLNQAEAFSDSVITVLVEGKNSDVIDVHRQTG